MKLEVVIAGTRYRVCAEQPLDISICQTFDERQPSAFGLPPATAHAFEADGYVTDVSRGGTVNCETITLTPHGNGTHTESYGHITVEALPVLDLVTETFVPATVVTIAPRVVRVEGVDFPEPLLPLDRFQEALRGVTPHMLQALVVRTLPNDSAKRHIAWGGTAPPYLAAEAVTWLIEQGVQHLLIDLPSADPERDGGRLLAHRALWQGDEGRKRTLTELIYVDNTIKDGSYLLNLQIAPFALEAAPSRPVLLPLEEVES